jgi:hypothetical protein
MASNFLLNPMGSTNFMRLSLMNGAHVDLSRAACREFSAQSRILALESAVSLKSRVPVYTSVSATTASAGWRPSEELLYSGAPSLSE